MSALWVKHPVDSLWHRPRSATPGQSVVTYCRGRWPMSEPTELASDPPADKRCEACKRDAAAVRSVDADGAATLTESDDDLRRKLHAARAGVHRGRR